MIPDPAIVIHSQAYALHIQGRMSEAEPLYRDALQLDPDFKEAWINLGLAAFGQGQLEAAEDCQRQALRIDPDMVDAHNNLGMIHYSLNRMAEAENCLRAALRLRPDHANATLNLGSVRQVNNHVREAEALFRRALTLGAEPARVKSNLALALLEQVRPEEAERCCRESLALRAGNPEARSNLALALLTMGRLKEGWNEYEARWEIEAIGPALAQLPQPRWTGQALHGETVLLYAEQGFGDTLQFCRFAPMVAAAGGRVVLVVPQSLRRLMATLDGVAEVLSDTDNLPAFDYHCPLLSLPFGFATTLETIPATTPYLRADPADWMETLADLPGLKVGLVWGGRSRTAQPHAVAIDKRRSMRLEAMAPLFSVRGCSFVSLQLGPPAAQLRRPPAGVELHDFTDRLGDWVDTAGLVAGLDLVIAVDTAVAHLAGALGKPVWLLNRFDSCWRWLVGREDSPWYPTLRQFRQVRPGDWEGVIERVGQALEDRVGG